MNSPSPRQAKAASTELQDVEAEFDTILYHITHDVRATLRAIQVLPTWIKQDLDATAAGTPEAVAENLEMLETQAARADQFLIDLRTYSRIGRLAETPTVISLEDAVNTAAASLPDSFHLTRDLDMSLIRAPGGELCLVLEALFSNAVKHHDRETGEIHVSAAGTSDGLQLQVQDDGPGIPAQFHDRVFDMMATLRSRDDCDGSGLGLSIARKIVSCWGGSVVIADTGEGRGTCVQIDLPEDLVVDTSDAPNVSALPFRAADP